MVVVGAGVFAVGYGRDRGRALVLGGLTTGLGVASMHYLGMAALRLHGDVTYDPVLVGTLRPDRRRRGDRGPVGGAQHQVARSPSPSPPSSWAGR